MKNRILLAACRGFCLALLVALAAGCASINHLRDAQDAFNQAAAADVQGGFAATTVVGETISSDLLGRWANARAGYGSALLSLTKITNEDERILRDEKLWGTKLALEALCHWKLGNYAKAIDAAREAQKTDQLYPRDRALMTALPGFVMTDYAFDLLTGPPPTNSADRTNLVKKVTGLLVGKDGAVEVIQSARAANVIEAEHPLHVFLLQAQLAAYRNYRKAYELLDQNGVPATAKAHTDAQAQIDDLAKRVSGDSGRTILNFWAERDHLTNRPPGSN